MDLARRELDPGIHDYAGLYAYSIEHPRQFWRAVWDFCGIVGKPGETVVEGFDRLPGARWFPEAQLNFAENLLRFRDDHPALVFRAETGQSEQYSYRELYAAVAKAAAALRGAGIEPGDRVAGFLPNLPEAVIAMLAASSIGTIWSSCSPDFGVDGVVQRFGQIRPRMLFCAAAHPYNGKQHDDLGKVREIVQAIDSIEHVVVVPYLAEDPRIDEIPNAVTYAAFTDNDAQDMDFERLPFDHPLYIL